MSPLTAELACSDMNAAMVWKICFTHTRHREQRLLPLMGYPRHYVPSLSVGHNKGQWQMYILTNIYIYN